MSAPIGAMMASGAGDNGIRFNFRSAINNLPWTDIANWNPQLVLRPFTRPEALGYDIVIDDVTEGSGLADVPGVVFNDNFNMEVYMRHPNGNPMWMIAAGRYTLNGFGYRSSGPLGPGSYPTGPEGPAGPVGAKGDPGAAGEPGLRGSRWYTGVGAPVLVPDARVTGDMYLNESNGDVFRWDGAAWTAFKGV